MYIERRKSAPMHIGEVIIGDGHPIAIQSMLSIPWHKTKENIAEAKALEQAGCDILRVAVPNEDSVSLISLLKDAVAMPIVADIHFDWRLALAALEAGADKIRINPGNIGSEERVKAVAEACAKKQVPIRIGVNSGSVEKHILEKYGGPTPHAMVESALYHAALLEKYNFSNIALSVKSNEPSVVIAVNQMLAEKTTYPLHLGVTHAGTSHMGLLKSAIGIGGLLSMGIGDTLRVSLTASPTEEIQAAKDILKAAGLGSGVTVISCPTCGRTEADVEGLAHQVEKALAGYTVPITVAVMGCVVNGPGEAKTADLGITAGGNGRYALFSKGEILATLPAAEIMNALVEEVKKIADERGA